MPESKVSERAVLFVAAIASFLTPFMGSSVNVALPAIAERFGLSGAGQTWVQTAYLLAGAVCLLPFGRVADLHGRKRVFALGIGLFTAASLACALAPTAGVLIGLRVVQGVASAMIFATAVAILSSVYPPQRRGQALGFTVAAVYLGLSMGPFLGGVLTEWLGWRAVFLATAPVGLAGLAATLAYLRAEWAPARGETFDLTGAIIYGVALVGLVLGAGKSPQIEALWLAGVGAAALVGFVLWQKRASCPLLDMGLFTRYPVFALSNLAALLQYAAVFAVALLISQYLQNLRGLDARQAGLVLLAQPVTMMVTAPVAGRLSDRFGPRLLASGGLGVTTVVLLGLTRLGPGMGLWAVAAMLAVLGVGMGLFSSPNVNAIMGAIDRQHFGVGAATLGTMRLTGQMASMAIVQLVFGLHLGSAAIGPETQGGFLAAARTDFFVFAALAGAAMAASLARGQAGHGQADQRAPLGRS